MMRKGESYSDYWHRTGKWPPRGADETPIAYHKRTKMTDPRYFHVHKGWYYCNPAHCHGRWRDKEERDKHLVMAYAALG